MSNDAPMSPSGGPQSEPETSAAPALPGTRPAVAGPQRGSQSRSGWAWLTRLFRRHRHYWRPIAAWTTSGPFATATDTHTTVVSVCTPACPDQYRYVTLPGSYVLNDLTGPEYPAAVSYTSIASLAGGG